MEEIDDIVLDSWEGLPEGTCGYEIRGGDKLEIKGLWVFKPLSNPNTEAISPDAKVFLTRLVRQWKDEVVQVCLVLKNYNMIKITTGELNVIIPNLGRLRANLSLAVIDVKMVEVRSEPFVKVNVDISGVLVEKKIVNTLFIDERSKYTRILITLFSWARRQMSFMSSSGESELCYYSWRIF